MAVRVWLDKDGKVLVSPEGNVYLSEECCCLKEPDPTVCWQLYSATVTTSEDGSSKGWSEPWMVDYTCMLEGAGSPGAAEWRYAGGGGATRWVSFPGRCSECSSPHGADRPGLNLACTAFAEWFDSAGIFFDTLYMNVATVVTYAVQRDEDGNSIGREVAGSTVIPNWRLTALTPDDTEDLIYSQVLGEARRVYAPRWGKSIADPDKTDPYVYWNMVGLSTATNSYTVYDGGWCPLPLANGVSLLTVGASRHYATGGHGLMFLTMVGSRYTALPVASTAMKTVRTALGCTVQTLAHFNTDQWGHLELGWSVGGDQWYDPYVHVHAHRIALGAMTPVSECSRHDRDLPRYLTQSMAPLWREYYWISHSIPFAAAADHAIDMALSGKAVTPNLSIYGVRCNTWWFRLIGESWDGCPKDDDGGVFQGWSVLYQGEGCPAYRYLDKLIPMTVDAYPLVGKRTGWVHEDDDALAAGSTVWRAFSSELGDGHCYSVDRLNIHNFPSWRTNLCSNAFRPVSAEVPNLVWKGSDIGKREWADANSSAGVGGAWPIQNLWIKSTSGAGWYLSQAGTALDAYYTGFVLEDNAPYAATVFNGGEEVKPKATHTYYNLAGEARTGSVGPCVALIGPQVTKGHNYGVSLCAEYLVDGFTYVSTRSYTLPRGYECTLTTLVKSTHTFGDGGVIERYGIDGCGVEQWKGCDANAPYPPYVPVNPTKWYRIWLFEKPVTYCSDGQVMTHPQEDEYPTKHSYYGSWYRLFEANPQLAGKLWQLPMTELGHGCWGMGAWWYCPPYSTMLGTASGGVVYASTTVYSSAYIWSENVSSASTVHYLASVYAAWERSAASYDVQAYTSPQTYYFGHTLSLANGLARAIQTGIVTHYDYHSHSSVYSDLTTIYESWYTEHGTISERSDGFGWTFKLYLPKSALASGMWAPCPWFSDYIDRNDTVWSFGYHACWTSYRTRHWNVSSQYITTVTHDNGDEEEVTRWTVDNGFSAETVNTGRDLYGSDLDTYGTPFYPLRPTGDVWTRPGYFMAGAVVSPGSATRWVRGSAYYTSKSSYLGIYGNHNTWILGASSNYIWTAWGSCELNLAP